MTSLHLFNFEKLKSEFQTILHIQYEIIQKRKTIFEKLHELKITYQTLVKNNTKRIFLFCLDSFYFQYKTLMIEMDNLARNASSINNRMYGDYYKLYNIILMQTAEANINIRGLAEDFKKYTPYKDLEPFHEYKMTDIIALHTDILKLVQYLYTHFASKEETISGYTENTRGGMSISSFLHTLGYENTLLREQIALYASYLTFFHTSQKGYLVKLFRKIQDFQTEIDEDVFTNHRHAEPIKQDASSPKTELDEFFITIKEEPTEIELLLKNTEEILEMSDKILDGLETTNENIEYFFLESSKSKENDAQIEEKPFDESLSNLEEKPVDESLSKLDDEYLIKLKDKTYIVEDPNQSNTKSDIIPEQIAVSVD